MVSFGVTQNERDRLNGNPKKLAVRPAWSKAPAIFSQLRVCQKEAVTQLLLRRFWMRVPSGNLILAKFSGLDYNKFIRPR
jgi:hypothetical protein